MKVPAFLDEGTGDPLVLLMGLGAPGETWRPHLDAWSRRFRCIAVDNRGAGATPIGAHPPTTRDLADDVAALIDRLGLGPVRVAGISMGACIAQELMLAYPGLVSRAVLVAPWASVPPSTAAVLEVLQRARSSGDARLFAALLRAIIWTPEWIDAHAAEEDAQLDTPPAMSVAAFAHQVHACASHDTLARLADVATPTLVTWGARDEFIRPELSARTAAAIPGAESVVFETGHVHHWEELDRFNRVVEEWLA